VVHGVLVAVSTNSLTRCAVAAISGGTGYALRIGAALGTSLALAWTAGAWVLSR
jgi:hypothetical protein